MDEKDINVTENQPIEVDKPEVAANEVNDAEVNAPETNEPEVTALEAAPVNTKKSARRGLVIGAAVAVAAIAVALIIFLLGANGRKYKEAMELLDDGEYADAYELFKELGDYKDAKEIASRFRYVPVKFTEKSVSGDKVEEKSTITVSYDKNNLPKQRIGYDVMMYGDTTADYTYDQKGNLTKMVATNKHGDETVCEFTYDNKGNLIKFVRTDRNGSNTSDFIYNENGDVLKVTYTYSDGVVSYDDYVYDEDGKLLKIVSGDSEGVGTITEYSYDEKDNLIRISSKQVDNDAYFNETILTYDDDGNLTKETYRNNSWGFEYETTVAYTYDAKGYIIKTVSKNSSGNTDAMLDVETTTLNTYDEEGNLIKTEISSGETQTIIEIDYEFVYIPFEMSDEEHRQLISELQLGIYGYNYQYPY